MSTQAIGELVAVIVAEAVGIANLQNILNHIDDPSVRKQMIMSWYHRDFITVEMAEGLIEHNGLEAA